ncbi:hypothetical protein NA56DRAFT_707432 [Hyaloscypha hepaticicola]|uniref:Uncharacterized protein n=1 Tax=Hyaloscypha hepaticicola TaxID=2082293 RepID=A0A2J6PUW0_9HELO|nr:hypothetical protein NA56DRAFT_707432 [Hyaloscypha hepaticicola]
MSSKTRLYLDLVGTWKRSVMGMGQGLTQDRGTTYVKIDASLLLCKVAIVSLAFLCILTNILTSNYHLATFDSCSSWRSLQITGDLKIPSQVRR